MDFEHIMLNEVSHRKTNTVLYHLYMQSKKVKFQKSSCKMAVVRGQRWGDKTDV